MTLLGKDQIFAADDAETRDVEVPEWGGSVRIRVLSGSERDKYESSLYTIDKDGKAKPNMTNARARLAAISIVDESGKRVFSDSEVVKLGGKSSRALDRVFQAAQELSGLDKEEIEALEEGFGEGQSESSTSA